MGESITKRQFEIIQAAGKIITQAGIGGLTIKKLANEMNFSESAVYSHFSSKEKIIVAMLNYVTNNMDERFTQLLEKKQNPEENFIALFQSQFSFFDNYPHFVVAVFSDRLAEKSDLINQSIKKIMFLKMEYLKPIVIAGQQKTYLQKAYLLKILFILLWVLLDFNCLNSVFQFQF